MYIYYSKIYNILQDGVACKLKPKPSYMKPWSHLSLRSPG